jgi:hypothetical protein
MKRSPGAAADDVAQLSFVFLPRGAPTRTLSQVVRERAPFLLISALRQAVPTSGTDKLRQIFLARPLGISWWRGTDSTAPVAGLVHSE